MNIPVRAQSQKSHCLRLALAGSVLALLANQSAQAAAGSWAAAVDGNWSDSTKWTSGTIANAATFTASFNVAGTGTYTVTLDSSRTIGSIAKGTASSGSWTIVSANGAVLTLDNGASSSQINNQFNGNTTTTVDADIVLNSNLLIHGNGNNNAKVVVGAPGAGRTITGNKSININNTVSNSGGVVTINSDINVVGSVSNSSSQGSNNHRINGVIGPNVTGVNQGSASGTSFRTLILAGANTYTSATTVNGGTLQAAIATQADGSGAFGKNSAVTIKDVVGATLSLNNFSNQIGSLAGGGTTGGNVSLGTATLTTGGDNTSTTYAGGITGSGGVTKIGTGTQTLQGAMSFTGATTISEGTLALGPAASLASATIDVGAAGTFDVSLLPSGFTVATGRKLGGDGVVAGSLTFAAGANFTFSPTATLDFTGNVSFGGFGIENLLGLDVGTVVGSYVILNGTGTASLTQANVANVGLFNAYNLGSDKVAYFEFNGNDLSVVVAASAIPEPGAFAALAGLATLGLAATRRRRVR